MKGQKALLLSFKKYFKKYSFLLFLLIVLVCFSSVFLSILDNMYSSYDYKEKAMVKGDALLYAPFSSSDVFIDALKKASGMMDDCITDIRVRYPSLSIYLEGEGDERMYLDAVMSPSLCGKEVLVLSEYVPKGDVSICTERKGALDYDLIVDDERALNLYINSHEALCSESVYKEIASYQNVSLENYYGRIEFDVKDGTDFGKLLRVLVEDCGLKEEGIENGYTKYLYIVDSKKTTRRSLSDWYYYDFKADVYRNDVIALFNERYKDIELVNEVDRFNTPVIFLYEFTKRAVPLLCMAFVFLAVSIYEVRRKEFKLYRDLGMSRAKLSLLLFVESCLLIGFVAVVSALVILLCSFILKFYAPLGPQLVKGKSVYFRDLYTLRGNYSMKGVWKRFSTYMSYISLFFVGVMFIFNSVMLSLDEKKEKKA